MYNTVVGLEIHVQLATDTKLFCGCSTAFTTEENKNICPVCTGHLGALPVLNEKALDYALKAALALNCRINKLSMFDRKNYFYPDLPKGYQISQFYHPYAENGFIDISNKRVRITRIHIEEDAGKLIHNGAKMESYVDYNRSSIPLIEIVTEPDISSPEEAQEFLEKIKTILKYTGISDVSMELGSLRCDANVSVKRENDEKLGTRVEIKNLNSFKAVAKAIEYEASRQISVISEGGEIFCETRLWDESSMTTKCMRLKENAEDYRYFPDPDLPKVLVGEERITRAKNDLPEFPEERSARFVSQYGLPEYNARVLVSEKSLADYFEEVVKYSGNPKSSSNWVITDILRVAKGEYYVVDASHLGKMIKMIDDDIISGKIAKEVFEIMLEDKRDPLQIVEEKGLIQITNESEIERIVEAIISKNPESIAQYRSGITKVLGFLVGQVMKETKGRANPALVNRIIISKMES